MFAGYAERMPDSHVITRFAPSPTGDLHIGGARSALFCWALAKASREGGEPGRFLLRLEDTDRARSSDASARAILEDMAWLGLDWQDGPSFEGFGGDERGVGPYEQSNRLDLYTEQLQKLLKAGRAYPAFDTPQELAVMRDAAQREKKNFVYRRADDYDLAASLKRMEAGEPCVLRFAADPEAEIRVADSVLGAVRFGPGELEDFVVRKADGFPTYHFAVVVDDALMGVTHVLRGQEHLSNTPKHVALQQAMGFPTPVYAHMPLLFNDKGGKMSKRERDQVARDALKQRGLDTLTDDAGDRAVLEKWAGDKKSQLEPADLERLASAMGIELPEVSVKDFRKAGYLPEVIVNFIALLGWTPPKHDDGTDREHFDAAFLAEHFTVEKIGKSNARFDRKKLLSFNMDAIAAMPAGEFCARFVSWATAHAPSVAGVHASLVTAVQGQSKTFVDAAERCRFAVEAPASYDEKAVKKFLAKNDGAGLRLLGALRSALAELEAWDAEALEEAVGAVAEREGAKMGAVAQPVRIALTGAGVSPAIGATLGVLGRDEAITRIDRCLAAHASLA